MMPSSFRLLLLTLLVTAIAAHRSIADAPPNIILIITDDQGYADLSAYDHSAPDIQTPHTDRIAKHGILFTQAYTTAPACSPSRAGLQYGKYQWRWGGTGWAPGVEPDAKNIAQRLQSAGYKTAYIGKNDYGVYNDSTHPKNLGYHEFLAFNRHAHDFFLHSQDIYDRTPDPDGGLNHLGPFLSHTGPKPFDSGYTTDIFTDTAIDFIQRHTDQPFFLTLSYNAVHHLIHQSPQKYLDRFGLKPIPNYNPDQPDADGDNTYRTYYNKHAYQIKDIVGDDLRQYYLANLACLDDNIGRLLNTLDQHQLTENTLIIFMSDNGGSPYTGANNQPLTAGKFGLFEGGIRVPFIISWPNQLDQKTYHHPVSTLDIMPTCLAAAGIDSDDPALEGHDLLPPLQADQPVGGPDRTLYWRWQGSYAMRRGDWKLAYTASANRPNYSDQWQHTRFNTRKLRLFNLKDDPAETTDLSQQHPQLKQKLYAEFQQAITVAPPVTLKQIGAVVTADSEETQREDNRATLAFDGLDNTIWHTTWSQPNTPAAFPHWIQADCRGRYLVKGIEYLPRSDSPNGRIADYTIQVSADGESWTDIATGHWPNDARLKRIKFKPTLTRYVRLVATQTYGDGKPHTSAAEFDIIIDPL